MTTETLQNTYVRRVMDGYEKETSLKSDKEHIGSVFSGVSFIKNQNKICYMSETDEEVDYIQSLKDWFTSIYNGIVSVAFVLLFVLSVQTDILPRALEIVVIVFVLAYAVALLVGLLSLLFSGL
jgi:hypothetical protein